MNSHDTIIQGGIIKKLDNTGAWVDILCKSACVQCHSKSACNLLNSGEKTIQVKTYPEGLKLGDEVVVEMKKSMGLQAVFWGYIMPFFLVIISLVLYHSLNFSEGISGILSLGILIPYYAVIYLLRDNFQHKFMFNIRNKGL